MIPQVGGFQGCYPDNHRNDWRCAETPPKGRHLQEFVVFCKHVDRSAICSPGIPLMLCKFRSWLHTADPCYYAEACRTVETEKFMGRLI